MRSTLKSKFISNRRGDQRGFTLVEMSIVIVIIGIMAIPAFHAYSLFKKQQVVEHTEDAMSDANTALGNFRGVFGRYPCPARADAVVGNPDYGYEFVVGGVCGVVAGGVVQVNSNNAANATVMANPEVYIGTIPFRSLNMDERFAYDGKGSRLTYAVTGLLTSAATYENQNGGISIVRDDRTGTSTDISAISVPDSAHFVVVSHGVNNDGAISRSGTVIGTCPGVSSTGENCDNDATFRIEQEQVNFDDDVIYFVSDSIEQWQISTANPQDIHLRRADNLAMGISETDVTTGMYDMEIRDNVPGDAVMLVEENLAGTEGQVLVDNVCDDGDTNCFNPRLLGGDRGLTPANGFECPPNQYVVAAEGGGFRCENEIWFSCRSGEFAAGFDANGRLICNATPPPNCTPASLATTCGPSRMVAATEFAGGRRFGYAFSGECHDIADWTATNTSDVDALPDIPAVEDYLNDPTTGLNYQARVTRSCDSVEDDALIRDTFECVGGAWDPSPVRTLERLNINVDNLGSFAPLYNSGQYPAETTGVTFNAAAPMSTDTNNSGGSHDCWCREDYRVQEQPCGGGLTGNRFRIRKHVCPQTRHANWVQVYPASGWDTRDCGCVASTGDNYETCRSHFPGPSNHPQGVDGNVRIPYTTTCVAGSPVTVDGIPDISQCTCPTAPFGDPLITTNPCPAGFINSVTYGGNNYSNVDEIYRSDWVCPTGPAPQQPISSEAEGGDYTTPTLVLDPVCNCNTSMPNINHTISCAAHPDFGPEYEGTGVHYSLPWTCPTGVYETPSDSNEVSRDCHECKWQRGSDNGRSSTAGGSVEFGQECPSCSGTQACFEVLGPGDFQNYSSCYCAGQP